MPRRVLLDISAVIDIDEWELPEPTETSPVVSTITVAELAFGLDIEDLIERRVRTDRFYSVLQVMAIVPFDLATARMYGTLASELRRRGRNPRPRRLDLQIAATASAHELPLITRNPADFTGLERFVEVIAV